MTIRRNMKTMNKLLRFTLVMLLVVASHPFYTQAQDNRLKFAVYVTGTKNGQTLKDTDAEMTSAHGTASDVMINSGLYEMIERSQAFLTQVREEQKYQQSGEVENQQIARIGKANGAQKICVVQLTIEGNGLQVYTRIVDVEMQTASQSGREQNRNYTGWLDVEPTVEKAVRKMISFVPSSTPTTSSIVNSNALFSGAGSGNGTGTGSGIGYGRGTGIGPGIGYGTGVRGYRRAPDISLNVSESGTVYVEVEINESGDVIAAKVITSSKYPTSITSSAILEECVRRAKSVKYISGKHEYRVIMFTNK